MSQLIHKEWMDERNRMSRPYLDGVAYFCAFAKEKDLSAVTCHCPCKKCRNRKRYTFDTVERHMVVHGMDLNYRVWYLHGEKPLKDSKKPPSVEIIEDVPKENIVDGEQDIGKFINTTFGVHGVLNGINDGNLDTVAGFEAYEHVKAADEKLKETSSEQDINSPSAEIDSDALHAVFGSEKKKRTRAVGSNISEKRLQQASLAKAVLAGPSSEMAEVKSDVVEVKSDVAGFKSDVGAIKDLLMTLLNQQGGQPPPLTPVNRTEIGSNLVDRSAAIKKKCKSYS